MIYKYHARLFEFGVALGVAKIRLLPTPLYPVPSLFSVLTHPEGAVSNPIIITL